MKAYELYALQEAEKRNINGGSNSTRNVPTIDITKPTVQTLVETDDPTKTRITLVNDMMNA